MDGSPVRPVGHLEKFLIHQHLVRFYNNVQVTAVYTVPNTEFKFNNDDIQWLVYKAIGKTLNRHPILGVAVRNEDSPQPEWIRLERVDLREIVRFIETEPNMTNLDAWIQDEHQNSFHKPQELPLWRCTVVVPPQAPETVDAVVFALSFSFHHAVGDGLSGAAFQKTFRQSLNEIISSVETIRSDFDLTGKEVLEVPKLALVPYLEESMALPLTPLFMLGKVFKTYLFSPVDTQEWSGPSIRDIRPPISHLRSFHLPQEVVRNLRSGCRRHQTTITALITVIVARALALLHPTHSRFVGAVPFSLRKFSKHSPDDMGCYTAIAEPYFSSERSPPWGYISCRSNGRPNSSKGLSKDDSLWRAAQSCKDVIRTRSESTSNLSVGLTKFVGDYRQHFLNMIGEKRRHAFTVTNIGVIDGGISLPVALQGDEKAVCDRLLFSVGASTNGSPYSVSVASATNGYMSVTLNWEKETVEESDANSLLESLDSELNRLAQLELEV
ncbi:uncharacterized protein CTRU02_209712 [Colletotrichum truncatum]|uniref:Uncharacterized protein n=1 Tax=Colletotrichum truncatum TaxID=5467 RepID=A0ACC3YUI2_COLTU|nr:uncharacterized protein CTRU02_02281 [Colletotrichum truncatum]KAF6798308.1 hypothetical protein CTRU02_02281 [Colletotrichum truncatum]